MASLYESYSSLPPDHPFRRNVPMDIWRKYVLQNLPADSERYLLHIVLFENVGRISTTDPHWISLGVVEAQFGGVIALSQYYAALWQLVDPSMLQARRVLSTSVADQKGKHPEHDTGLGLVQKQTDKADEKSTREIWIAVGTFLATTGLSFGAYILSAFLSGALTVAAATVSVGASIVSTAAGVVGSNLGAIIGTVGDVSIMGGQMVAFEALTQVVNRVLVPLAESAVGSIGEAFVGSGGMQAILDTLIEQNPAANFEELFEIYRRENHPDLEDEYSLEDLEEDFRLAMGNRAELPADIAEELLVAEDMESAVNFLTQSELESVTSMLQEKEILSEGENSLLGRLIAKGVETGEEIVAVAEGEAVVAVAIGAEGAATALSMQAVESAVVSTTSSLSLANIAPGIGLALALGAVVYEKIQEADARNKVIGLIDDANLNFKWSLDALEQDLRVKIDVPVRSIELHGDYAWDKGTFYWSARDYLGDCTLKYLRWRKSNPDIVFPTIQIGAAGVAARYRKYISVGMIAVQDWFPQMYSPEQLQLCAGLKIETYNHDEREYLHTLGLLTKHKTALNLGLFKADLTEFFQSHEKAREETTHPTDVALLQFLVDQQGVFHSDFNFYVSEQEAPLDADTISHLISVRNLIEQLDGIESAYVE